MPEESPKFSAAEVDLVLHATEDEGRMLQSVQEMLSISADRFSKAPSEGHFKNRIMLYKATLASREASGLAVRIVSGLNSTDREHLSRSLHEYSDERGNLYLRLDKQRLIQGKVSLTETDAVRIKFKPIRRYKPSGTLETYRGLLSSTE